MATRKIEMVTVRWLRSTADAAKPFGHVWTSPAIDGLRDQRAQRLDLTS